MKTYVDNLVDMGFWQKDPLAEWHAAPLLVHKPNSRAKFRMTVDLRPVNSATVKEAWPMPNLDAEVADFSSSNCFAVLDFVFGYWQLPLHPDSYTACGIVTPHGIYTSKRVLPGLANATAHFQRSVDPLFATLRGNLKAWLDDLGIYAKNETALITVLDRFFTICSAHCLFSFGKKVQIL